MHNLKHYLLSHNEAYYLQGYFNPFSFGLVHRHDPHMITIMLQMSWCTTVLSNQQAQCWLHRHIDGSVQDCSNSIANALELLQSCTKPSTYVSKCVFACWWLWMCFTDCTGIDMMWSDMTYLNFEQTRHYIDISHPILVEWTTAVIWITWAVIYWSYPEETTQA